jgi:hypothetical protein
VPLLAALYAMNKNLKLLLHYLFVYPLYYVVAMAFGTGILALIYSWSFEYAQTYFLAMALIMGVSSYFIHWRIGFFAIGELVRERNNGL